MSDWISVKDKLPEEDGYYMVYSKGYWGNNRLIGDLAISNFNKNYKTPWGIERGRSRGWAGIITHWMPLPEPPKQEEDEHEAD